MPEIGSVAQAWDIVKLFLFDIIISKHSIEVNLKAFTLIIRF